MHRLRVFHGSRFERACNRRFADLRLSLQSACLIRSATINIVSKHTGTVAGRVSHVTANWFRCRPRPDRGPWHWHPWRSPPGTQASRAFAPSSGPHRQTVTLTSRWKPREYGNPDGYDVGGDARWKRLSLSPFSFRSLICVSPPDVVIFSAGRSALRAWPRHPGKFFLYSRLTVPEHEGKISPYVYVNV